MKPSPRKHSLLAPIVSVIALALIGAVLYLKFHQGTPPATQTTDTKTVASKQSETSANPIAHTDSQLQSLVDSWAAAQHYDTTVVVQELDGDLRGATHRATQQMITASTYKIYVAYAVLHEVEQGTYTMNTTTRTGQTVSAALNKMILQSDNASAEALGFLVGWDKINQLASAAGTTQTDINNYNSAGLPLSGSKLSTATDLTTVITKLQSGTLLNATNTKLLLDLMKAQVWRQRIPAGVPAGVSVADKPGWLIADNSGTPSVQNDAAIVYGPHSTYTLVVMTGSDSTRPLADLSEQVYDYLQE